MTSQQSGQILDIKDLPRFFVLEDSAYKTEFQNGIYCQLIHNLGYVIIGNLACHFENVLTICRYLGMTMELHTEFSAECNASLGHCTATKTNTEIRTELLHTNLAINVSVLVDRQLILVDEQVPTPESCRCGQ